MIDHVHIRREGYSRAMLLWLLQFKDYQVVDFLNNHSDGFSPNWQGNRNYAKDHL
jgi:hypothetical protein